MAFNIAVVFSNPKNEFEGQRVLAAASRKWPWTIQKWIQTPIQSAAISSPDLTDYHYLGREDQLGDLWELVSKLETEELSDWSKSFPEMTFAFINVDCTGGTCLNDGYACQNGKILERIKADDADEDTHIKLIMYLGFRVGKFFEPFTRNYFDPKE